MWCLPCCAACQSCSNTVWACNVSSAMYWHTSRLQFPLSRVSRCNIYYCAVLQLDMKHCWFYSFFVWRCALNMNWINYASCIVLAFSVLAFSTVADSYLRFPYLCFPVLAFLAPPWTWRCPLCVLRQTVDSSRSIRCPRSSSAANQLHVAATIDYRDRQIDGQTNDRRTDTVPLHRRSPLEASSVNSPNP